MPTMQEIYQGHSVEYDELVSCEDYEDNLAKALSEIVDFSDKAVLELGAGTGRVTKLFSEQAARILCCDVSNHMIERAKMNLAYWGEKITFEVLSSLQIPSTDELYDIAIEGWSFGHLIPDSDDEIPLITNRLIESCKKNLKPDGTIVIIETLGTNVNVPGPTKSKLSSFFELLESKHGFEKRIISTDYKFSSNDEAARVMGFFFGEKMKEAVRARGTCVIPEFTGIWYRNGGWQEHRG